MTLSRIRSALARRRKGAVALVAVASMLPVAGMMTASLNSSQMVDDRRATQDAADALSRMHGAWAARSMNILAMNAVTETQLLTVALGSESLMGTLVEQQLFVIASVTHVVAHGVRECPPRLPFPANLAEIPWVVFCTGFHGYATVPAFEAQFELLRILDEYDPIHGMEVAHKGLEAIEGMNRALLARFPRAVREIGEDYAGLLEIERFHFDEPCDSPLAENCQTGRTSDGMALPVKEGGFDAEHARCLAMNNGTTLPLSPTGIPRPQATTFYARGFPVGDGPLRHGGGSGQGIVKDFINAETGVGAMLNAFKTAYDRGGDAHLLPRYQLWPLGPVLLTQSVFGFSVPAATLRGFGGGVVTPHPPALNLQFEQDAVEPNSFTRRFDAKLFSICPLLVVSDQISPGLPPEIEVPAVELPDFEVPGGDLPVIGDLLEPIEDIANEAQEEVENALDDVLSLLQDLRPPFGMLGFAPYLEAPVIPTAWELEGISPLSAASPVEPADMPEEFQILAFGQMDKSTRLGSRVFVNTAEPHNAYGQTGLFNPDGADIYSQNWRYRLMPSLRMDTPAEVASRMDNRAPAEFSGIADVLGGIGDLSSWGRIHAH